MSSWLRQTSCGSGCWPQTDCGRSPLPQSGETVVTAGVHLLYVVQKVKTVGAAEAVAKAR
jgi:hypothetical protein